LLPGSRAVARRKRRKTFPRTCSSMKMEKSLRCTKIHETNPDRCEMKKIGSLEKTRSQLEDKLMGNRRYTAAVPRNFELEYEQPRGSRCVPFGSNYKGVSGA
jgi:hypothetical protein